MLTWIDNVKANFNAYILHNVVRYVLRNLNANIKMLSQKFMAIFNLSKQT